MSAAALPPGLFTPEQTEALNKAFATVDATEADNFAQIGVATTTTFILCCMGMVFIMQLGFAMLCAGMIRTKNANNIMLKNILDAAVGSIVWYVLGYGFAYGISDHRANAFIGNHDFALSDTTQNNWLLGGAGRDSDYRTSDRSMEFVRYGQGDTFIGYIFQWVFAAATATIVSGAVAERITFVAYIAYSIHMVGFVYPVCAHAVWSPIGWLSGYADIASYPQADVAWRNNSVSAILNTGAIDYAGSGVVHMVGGVAALVGAVMLGPRIGRFKDGKVTDFCSSTVLVVLGTLLLWFGWYGFNPGTWMSMTNRTDSAIVGRAAVITTLAGGSGGLTALLFRFWRTGNLEVVWTCNGILAGLVASCSGPTLMEPWAALICGSLAGLVMYGSEMIDDCVGAFSVHGAVGAYSLIFIAFFAKPAYMKEIYGPSYEARKRYGLFYGGHGQVLLANVVELVFIVAWVVANFTLLFGLLKVTGKLRVPPEVEHAGLDVSVHGSRKGVNNAGFVEMSVESSDMKSPGKGGNTLDPVV